MPYCFFEGAEIPSCDGRSPYDKKKRCQYAHRCGIVDNDEEDDKVDEKHTGKDNSKGSGVSSD